VAKHRPNFEKVNERIAYDRDTGKMRSRRTNQLVGFLDKQHFDDAGRPTASMRIKIAGRCYPATHVAWLLTTGEWPTGDVTFKNGNCDDFRFDNLTLTTAKERARNRDRNSKGYRKHGNRFIVQVGTERRVSATIGIRRGATAEPDEAIARAMATFGIRREAIAAWFDEASARLWVRLLRGRGEFPIAEEVARSLLADGTIVIDKGPLSEPEHVSITLRPKRKRDLP
jgi:hypothetical protein